MLDEATASCPWCGEPMQLELDPSGAAQQRYVEDCWVCCHPCVITAHFDGEGGVIAVQVEQE